MAKTTSWGTAARQAALAGALALTGGAALAGAAAAAPHPVPISSCPYTIMAAGTYVLTRDLSCAGPAPAITVAPHVDNVRLVLGGRALTGDGSGNGIVAAGSADNPITGLRISLGTVTGFVAGVLVDFAPGAWVVGVTATGNSDRGIDVEQSPNARVAGNTASRNGDNGIRVDDCVGCDVAFNRTADNAQDSIFASSDNTGARFVSNTAVRSGRNGFDLNGCANCLIAGNLADGNRSYGIDIGFDSTGMRVAGNTARGNGLAGLSLGTGSVDDNLVQGNTTQDNGGGGIEVVEGAVGNRLEGNRATGNTPFDLIDENLDLVPPACANTWRRNRFATDNEGDGPGAGCIR